MAQQHNVRKPSVAGHFYPAGAKQLKEQIESFADWDSPKKDIIGCVVPHAGYMYSGYVAAEVISRIKIKENVIILGPNHTGYGETFGIMTEGLWHTPLGDVPINNKLAQAMLKSSEHLKDDSLSHLHEHSIEVELPFLQYAKNDFKLVPVVIGPSSLKSYKEVGETIGKAIDEMGLKDSCLIAASSDMTHYESRESAQEKDERAISSIIRLDENRLWDEIKEFNISMCGYAPVIVMLSAAKYLGAKKAELVKYQTSGDVTQDYSSVVGYAGIIVY